MRQSCLTVFVATLLAIASCRKPSSAATAPAPTAEFVLVAGDSAFWVTSDASGVKLRGAPIGIARVAGRFYEFYVVDDDRSYQDADLIGQSVYRRDLRTGDSVRVFTDSVVPALAREYGRTHPDEEPLASGDEPDANPFITATATLELGETHGQFVSYSLHTDVERRDAPLWHASRRGVLNLATAKPATLSEIAGPDAASVVATATKDSHARLDAASFSIVTIEGAPAVQFAAPGSGTGDAGRIGAITAVPLHDPSWWREATPSLPTTSAAGSRKVWRHGSYSVVTRDNAEGGARLFLRDSTSREWLVGSVARPTRIYWLDDPRIDTDTRRALVKAFNEAATYDSESLVALSDGSRIMPLQ